MTRVVADTNIFVSALIFGGVPGTFLDLALMGAFQLITSPVLLDELDEKLRLKFELPDRYGFDPFQVGSSSHCRESSRHTPRHR